MNNNLTCEEIRPLMMGLIDNELDQMQIKNVRSHLENCSSCKLQYESFLNLKKETEVMKSIKYPEDYWDGYWETIYNRIERGISWLLISIGAVLILGFGAYEALREFFNDTQIPLLLRAGIGVFVIGTIMLVVSVIREKITTRKQDIYRRIKR
ncbi:MAG: zf-HC2 domain-containing protein [Calditrichaceae bacterium]